MALDIQYFHFDKKPLKMFCNTLTLLKSYS